MLPMKTKDFFKTATQVSNIHNNLVGKLLEIYPIIILIWTCIYLSDIYNFVVVKTEAFIFRTAIACPPVSKKQLTGNSK